MNAHNGNIPPISIFHEYFYLFTPSGTECDRVFQNKLQLGDSCEKSLKFLNEHQSMFGSFDEFVLACLIDKEN